MRQKLSTYYQTEGSNDAILVALPKGAYKLSFQPSAGTLPPTREHERPRRIVLCLAVTCGLLAVWALAATILVVREHHQLEPAAESWSPELEALWSPFLQSKRSLLVCLGTPLFVRFPEFGFFRDPKANDWQEIEKSARVNGVRKALGDKEIHPLYSFTGAGEASAGFLLAKLLATRKREMLLTRSSILSWQQIADNDLIFLGAAQVQHPIAVGRPDAGYRDRARGPPQP